MKNLDAGQKVKGPNGTYTIQRKIKEGGMGIVFLASSEDGESVVVKIPNYNISDDEHTQDDCLLKLIKEGGILQNIREREKHENIAEWVDNIGDKGGYLLVLKYVNGKSLAEIAEDLDSKTKVRYVMTLLKVLDDLHTKYKIVHRDIKPSNILIEDNTNRLVLIDFGTAKELKKKMPDTTKLGTWPYSSPQVIKGKEIFFSDDLYSVGVILLYLFGVDPSNVIDDIKVSEPGLQLEKVEGYIDKDLAKIIAKAMEFNQRARYQSASEMLKSLEEWLDISATLSSDDGIKFQIRNELEVGRAHEHNSDCGADYFLIEPESVDDPKKIISRHHARIFKGSQNEFYIMDLGSVNGTAVSRDDGHSYRVLRKHQKELLHNGDMVALGYDNIRHKPYLQLRFRLR